MRCPKCGNENIKVQVVNEVHIKNAHHGCLWGCLSVGGGCLLNGWLLPYRQLYLKSVVIKNKKQSTSKNLFVYVKIADIAGVLNSK